MEKLKSATEYNAYCEKLKKNRDSNKKVITVCAGTGCTACGCEAVMNSFKELVKKDGLEKEIEIKATGCRGFCERGPLVGINPVGTLYQGVNAESAQLIWEKSVKGSEVVDALLYRDPVTQQSYKSEKDIPFYKKQTRNILAKSGTIDPTAIGDYLALGGYQAMVKALTAMSPEEVIREVSDSGLRGRGGNAISTGRKWDACRKAKGDQKYVVCNADSGDLGSFMERALLEGNPHQIIEGMIIGAFAIGSHEGWIYVRNEYRLAVKNLNIALKAARDFGLLGENILGTGFTFDIEVSRGGGAFVCSDSTALIASLEGKVSEPRAKYIHTVEAGLWEKPTNLNHAETWANIALIIDKGAKWFAGIGVRNSKGTKVFGLTGMVNNTGVVEVPMGTTPRELVFGIGGGVSGGKKFKALQMGGPLDGMLMVEFPQSLLDMPIDFDELEKAGAKLGSGSLVVMDEDTCMVDMAKHFINFFAEESCGKCVPCREGLAVMLNILNKICRGEGTMADIDHLQEISRVMADTSLCQLGANASNPVLSTLRHFRDEYLAHIVDKRCPAGVCKELAKNATAKTSTKKEPAVVA